MGRAVDTTRGSGRRLRSIGDDPRWLMLVSVVGFALLIALAVVLGRFGIEMSSRAVAGVGGSLVVLFIVSFASRRMRTLGPEMVVPVRELRDAVRSERRRPADHRDSGASDDSLSRVLEELDSADDELSGHREAQAAQRLQQMSHLTEDWAPASDLRQRAVALVAHGDKIAGVYAWTVDKVRKRPSWRSRSLARGATSTDAEHLPVAESYPSVMGLLLDGDLTGATKDYRSKTSLGLADSRAAVLAAARRHDIDTGEA